MNEGQIKKKKLHFLISTWECATDLLFLLLFSNYDINFRGGGGGGRSK